MGKLQRLRRRILQLESVMAVDSSDGRQNKRALIELRDAREPGGSLSGSDAPPFDREVELAKLEIDEQQARISNNRDKLHTLRAEYSATVALYVAITSIVVSVVGITVSIISLVNSFK